MKATNRHNSRASERRARQDAQARFIIVVLAAFALLAWLWTSARSFFCGALLGASAPLLIIALRYLVRVLTGVRMDAWGIFSALFLSGSYIAICYILWPSTLWQYAILSLCFVATVIGLQRFRISAIFLLLNFLIVGGLLL